MQLSRRPDHKSTEASLPEPPLSAVQSAAEIDSLTGLRGLAALYVVSYHHRIGVPFSNPATTLLAHGYLAVDLFFVLSGFLMALTYGHLFREGFTKQGFGKFLGRRIARIYPLYFSATLAGFFLVIAGCLQPPKPLPLNAAFVLNLLMVQTWGFVTSIDGPGWSVSAEWAAYLLFPAFVIFVLHGNAFARWSAGFVSVATLGTLCMLPESVVQHTNPQKLLDLYGPNFGLPIARCLPEFMLGLLAYRVFLTPLTVKVRANPWFATAVCLSILALLSLPRTDLAVVLLFPILILSIASGKSLPVRVLSSPLVRLSGALSYSIYLTHELVNAVVKWAFSANSLAGLAKLPFGPSALTILLTIPIASLAYITIEVPARQRLRRFFETGTKSDGSIPQFTK